MKRALTWDRQPNAFDRAYRRRGLLKAPTINGLMCDWELTTSRCVGALMVETRLHVRAGMSRDRVVSTLMCPLNQAVERGLG
jgi:hypothetical protein